VFDSKDFLSPPSTCHNSNSIPPHRAFSMLTMSFQGTVLSKSSHVNCLSLFCLSLFILTIINSAYFRPNTIEPQSVPVNILKSKANNQLIKNPLCGVRNDGEERWSNRLKEMPLSSVRSMFNCDLPGSFCKYYFPFNFFDEKCGIGKEFAYHVTDAEAMRQNRTLWPNMPLVGFPTLTLDGVCISDDPKYVQRQKKKGRKGKTPFMKAKFEIPNEDTSTLKHIGERTDSMGGLRCLTERLSMIHVHKAGGTSLHRSIDRLRLYYNNVTVVRHKFFTPKKENGSLSSYPPPSENSKIFDLAVKSVLHATKYPTKSFETDEHVIFAVVRDPVERFISSIGQAMGGDGSQGNVIGKKLQEKCIKPTSTSAETLKCTAKYVQKHSFWIELHFTPQALEISFTTVWQDAPIAIFPFQKLPYILEYLGGAPEKRYRDGSDPKYRPHPVLTNMLVSDYDEESLRIVCEIYEMDVIMQRSLGLEVPKCDPFIP